MNPNRRKLPIGIETFSEIIGEGHYYVDKTGFAQQMIEHGKYFFLSRPRRFGKSLFLDMLKELFECNEALFKGLTIHDKWDWGRAFPVLNISFGDGVLASRAELDEKIKEILLDNQERLGVTCTHTTISGQFTQLVRLAHQRHGQRVVVLIDEYDKPLLDNIADKASALAIREGLKNFYTAIKKADADLRFVFMTGVSKFSKVSLFSGLNNLNDITLDPRYSAICGYTDADVDTVFAPELAGLPREEIRRWYNGYNWLGEAVYNPYDLLLLFDKRKFDSYWFETATPTFLVKLLAERHAWLPNLDGISTSALLFQAGYLTIAAEETVMGRTYYQVRFPNQEVSQAFMALCAKYGPLPRLDTEQYHRLV